MCRGISLNTQYLQRVGSEFDWNLYTNCDTITKLQGCTRKLELKKIDSMKLVPVS